MSRCVRHVLCPSSVLLIVYVAGVAHGADPELRFAAVQKVLEDAVAAKAFPGATAAIGNSDGVLWVGIAGHFDREASQRVSRDTIYDLASLTKVVSTTSVILQLVESQRLDLDDRVAKWLPEFLDLERADPRRDEITLRQLLTHSSGLPSWKPLYKSASDYPSLLGLAARTPLENAPGTRYEYSDLGMILAGEIASRAGGKPLSELERELVFKPLDMRDTLRNPPEELRKRIAPTEEVADLGVLRGVVHDENARAGEGLTGHAGLFSTVDDLARFAREMLRSSRGQGDVFSNERVAEFVTLQSLPGDAKRGLGWQIFTPGFSGGTKLSARAFGHTGFTGTSIWIDPERDIFLVLLTNRVHPTRANQQIGRVRRNFADAAIDALASPESGK